MSIRVQGRDGSLWMELATVEADGKTFIELGDVLAYIRSPVTYLENRKIQAAEVQDYVAVVIFNQLIQASRMLGAVADDLEAAASATAA